MPPMPVTFFAVGSMGFGVMTALNAKPRKKVAIKAMVMDILFFMSGLILV
jgi:hypothetical protein